MAKTLSDKLQKLFASRFEQMPKHIEMLCEAIEAKEVSKGNSKELEKLSEKVAALGKENKALAEQVAALEKSKGSTKKK